MRTSGTVSRAANDQAQKPWALIDLPPFPAIAMRVLQLIARDGVGMKELSVQIQADPALASELLKLANSALFAFRNDIRTVLQATAMLGIQRVKALALTVGMRVYLMESFQIPALLASWRHSLATSLIAEKLAVASSMEKDFAHTAGLFHDIGRLALGMIKPMEYAELLDSFEQGPTAVLPREKEMFGIDHCQAGMWLARSWKLPAEFGEVAAHHHSAPGTKFDIVALVQYSCRLADAVGFSAFQKPGPVDFDALIRDLPQRTRSRFQPDPKDLATEIAIKIQSLEDSS